MDKKKFTAIILSAGTGSRMKSNMPKQYMELLGQPVIYYSIKAFEDSPVDEIVVVCSADYIEYFRHSIIEKYGFKKVKAIVQGGKERYNSVYEGLKAAKDADYVLIHDGARPFVDEEIIKRAYTCVEENRACVAGMPSKDTVKISDGEGFALSTPDRRTVWNIQTPQVFETALIRQAYFQLMENEENENIIILNDENGNEVESPDYYYMNGVDVEIKPMTQEEVENLKQMLYTFNQVYTYDQELMNIISEESAAFFSGQKNARDVASIIQSRVQIYVNENR